MGAPGSAIVGLAMAMVSVTQLSKDVAELERQTTAIRLKAEEKKLVERERLQQVRDKQQDYANRHAEAVAEAMEEHERQMNNVLERAERECSAVAEEKAQGMQRIRDAEDRSAELEAEVRELEKRWRQLNSQMDAHTAMHERKSQELIDDTNRLVQEREDGTRHAIQCTTLFTSEMQESSLVTIIGMQDEAKVHVAGAESGAKVRTRFQEFYDTLQSQKAMELSPEALHEAKMQLLQAWADDWVHHTHQNVPDTPAVLCAPPEQTMKPLSPTRVRQKETSLKVATMQQLQQQQEQELQELQEQPQRQSMIGWCDLHVPN